MDHLELANRLALQKLQEQLDTVKKISTAEGFYLFWFNKLPEKEGFQTNKACFNYVNELHNELLGYYRYSDYNSFSNFVTRRNKQLKNNGY